MLNSKNKEVKNKNDTKIILCGNEIGSKHYNISSIYYTYLKTKTINLCPTYQRGLSWSYDKMNLFLDTLFYCPVIPSFVLYQMSDNDRNESKIETYFFECIDGQHRLTVIQNFIENKPIEFGGNIKYLFIKDRETKEKIFYDLTDDIKKKYKKEKIRKFSPKEKMQFDDTGLNFQTIQKKLSNEEKCELFNRLQNGEKTNSVVKFKNFNHPITNFIREKNLVIDNDKLIKDWKQILIFDENNDKRNKTNNLKDIILLLVRLIIITYKKTHDVNFLDINIMKYIENNYSAVDVDKDKLDEIYEKIEQTKEEIKKIFIFEVSKDNEQNITEIIKENYYFREIEGKKFYLLQKLKNTNGKIIKEFYYLIHLIALLDFNSFKKIIFMDNENFDFFNNIENYKDINNKYPPNNKQQNNDKDKDNKVIHTEIMKENFKKLKQILEIEKEDKKIIEIEDVIDMKIEDNMDIKKEDNIEIEIEDYIETKIQKIIKKTNSKNYISHGLI
jgi:hypothetical protein